MGTLIVVGVIVLVLVVFVGLVWLFVRLSRPVAAPPTAAAPAPRPGANRPQRQNTAAGKKRKKASGRKRR